MVGKFKDKRDILYISTEVENNMVTHIIRHGEEEIKPEAIVKYNHFIKGVDRSDQLMSYYPCEQKSLRWYKKMFVTFYKWSLSIPTICSTK